MNESKAARLEETLNGMARKVYNAIPIQDSWTVVQIVAELNRSGANADHRVVLGCVGKMIENGLVREAPANHYQRVPVRPSARAAKALTVVEAVAPKAAPTGALDRLGSVATELRETSRCLVLMAELIEDIAIEVEERAQRDTDAASKLRQLQEVLKSIGQ